MDGQGWSRWHHRVHRQLLDQPTLLPAHSRLLLAVSGGQDSMALLRLLLDLRHLHHWSLQVWHGDHRWHSNSGQIASALEAWCQQHGQTLLISRADPGDASSESTARAWRYRELLHHCRRLNADAVTAHTASDRAETMLINLARGSDLAGLCSLPGQRALSTDHPNGPRLRRPLLQLSRGDTASICTELQLPIWLDPSNASPIPTRNRIRHSVLPVLETLHPGCSIRMAALAERLSDQERSRRELSDLALRQLGHGSDLDRHRLAALSTTTRQQLLAHWLKTSGVPTVSAAQLLELSGRLEAGQPGGQACLSGGWTLSWQGGRITLAQGRR
ncbi:MAG: tRNA lysidine(34) synthetase TilS [Synechococcus sp.]